jgi:hypothetical protein
MRERVDTGEAIRLYHTWRNWRDVALRLPRKTRTPFAADAVQAAVRRHDRLTRDRRASRRAHHQYTIMIPKNMTHDAL